MKEIGWFWKSTPHIPARQKLQQRYSIIVHYMINVANYYSMWAIKQDKYPYVST